MNDLRLATPTDFQTILALNDAEVQKTSPMDLDRLRALVNMAAIATVVAVDNRVEAFLIAFRDGAPYENPNYNWFSARFQRFVYVDRIVVNARCAGRGIGKSLYDHLFAFARAQGVETVTCEYNLVPPNPASRAFHDKYGFHELGTQWVADDTKLVSLQAAAA